MKAITRYQANDGTEFKTESKCAAYEALCDEVAAVMAAFPILPDDGCEFANGGGYIQHDPETFSKVRTGLLRIALREYDGHHWIAQSLSDENVHPSYVARLVGESNGPLNRAWGRISCTDKQFREWGQPYYASNPDKAKQVRINP